MQHTLIVANKRVSTALSGGGNASDRLLTRAATFPLLPSKRNLLSRGMVKELTMFEFLQMFSRSACTPLSMMNMQLFFN